MVIDSNNGIKPGNNGGNSRPSTVAPRESGPQSGAAGSSPRPASRDSVELSAEAQSMNRLEENLAQLPDVDVERVASLKQAIAEGRFEIDPERIAQNMLNQDDLLG
ncbi:FlgM family anti-sigma-28 factor [Marinimicrobium koreense]|uniref:Negative regulator of flagellin synthesis n=1 Tax=Marinimicrobium koreense TaxID=306545 RepID=A0A3N1NW81_9GAMM|nr:flagellar biosynthesis anti-sigma factor FlgM [Marinimicrobium koreense]ROQ20435.1 FlgM family anti-sigma-28 factor [Marinimicrobium koreense]